MMNDLNAIFREVGSLSLDLFWFPLLIWSICALIVYLVLKIFKESDVLYQYHIRVALVAGIPLGILGSLSTPFFSRLFLNSDSTDSFAFIVVQNPIRAPLETGVSMTPNWSDPNVWVGFLSLYLASASLLLGLQLIWNYIRVSSLAGKFDLLGLRELKRFDYMQTGVKGDFVSRISVAFSSEVSIPFTFGWRKPVIVVPAYLKENPEKTELVILHELTHIRHSDYLLNAFVLSVKSLFWFHPLIYLFDREIREYREILCDTQVLADRKISPKKYAQLLFELTPPSSHSGNSPALNMSVNKSTLLKRIQSIRILGSSRSFSKSLAVSLTLLTALSVFIACSDLQTTVASGVASSLNVEQTPLDGMFTHSGTEEDEISSNPGEEPPPPSQQSQISSTSMQSGSSQTLTLQQTSPPAPAFVVVEEMPQLIGGLTTLQQKIEYPQSAIRAGIEGTVVVRFVVDEQGDVENPRIIERVGGGTDEEALRVIRSAKFEPGRQRGRPVRVQYVMPFVFKLMETDSASDTAPEGKSNLS